jgi:hypothetical protein
VLDERKLPDGRRKITLRKSERDAMVRRQRAEAAASLFLDLEVGRTWAQIAQELGLSTAQLKDLTKTKEVDEAYNQLFAELGHDPRYKAAQGALSDMLPLAVNELKQILTNRSIAAGTRLKAVERVMALNGLSGEKPIQSDRSDLVKFLVEHKISLDDMKVPVPNEYNEYMNEIVDGEFYEPPELPSGQKASD